jgi:hypothetical protein
MLLTWFTTEENGAIGVWLLENVTWCPTN